MDAGAWISLISVIVGVAVAVPSLRAAARSAAASRRAAEEAAAVSRIEAERRADERERRHDELAPALSKEIIAQREENPRSGYASLFGEVEIIAPRDYRASAIGRSGSTSWPMSIDTLVRGGQTYRFHIEQLAPDQTEARTEYVLFRFWPPIAEIDETHPWSCPCDRPTVENGPGHWEKRVPVSYYDIASSIH